MLRTITQKCPCGYVFVEQQHLDGKTIPVTINGQRSIMPTKETKVVKFDYLEGDEEFAEIFVAGALTPHAAQHPEMKLLACPKCGTILAPWVAMKVEVTEE